MSVSISVRNAWQGAASEAVLRVVQQAYAEYEVEVDQSDLSPATKQTYTSHARDFVRWMNGQFTPGASLGTSTSGD